MRGRDAVVESEQTPSDNILPRTCMHSLDFIVSSTPCVGHAVCRTQRTAKEFLVEVSLFVIACHYYLLLFVVI